jgi:hypothetical protein
MNLRGLGFDIFPSNIKSFGIYADGNNGTTLGTIENCWFEKSETGSNVPEATGIYLQNSSARVMKSTFKNLTYGLYDLSQNSHSLSIEGNQFEDNRTSINLEAIPVQVPNNPWLNFTLKCNHFRNTPQTSLSPITRKGLVVGEGVQLRAQDANGENPNQIGGNGGFLSGSQYPNANIWPTPDFDEMIPISGQPGSNPLDVNDVWTNSPSWVSIENQNLDLIIYHRFFNEFVGKGMALVNTEMAPVTFLDESVITEANLSSNSLLTTVPACSLLVDPNPVLFPARIAVVGRDSTTSSVSFQKIGKGLELSDPIPNPAFGKVLILAKIPFQHEKALLQIIQTGTGKVLQNIDLAQGSNLEITLDVEKSPSGTYQYRLIVDGSPTKPKTLVVRH